jgi:hypothetical protein
LDFIFFNFIFTYFNFIQFYLFNYFFLSIQFYINYSIQFYFLIITNGFTDGIHLSVFSKVLEQIYCMHMPQSPTDYFCRWFTEGNTDKIYPSVYSREFEKKYYICHYHRWKFTNGIFPVGICFWHALSVYKIIGF